MLHNFFKRSPKLFDRLQRNIIWIIKIAGFVFDDDNNNNVR